MKYFTIGDIRFSESAARALFPDWKPPATAKVEPHPEVVAFATSLARRPSSEVAAAFVIDMIEDAKEGLLSR